MRFLRVGLLALAMVATGCASTGGNGGAGRGPGSANDPAEGFNRAMFAFNEGLDMAVAKPVATAYRSVMPGFLRAGISNFFGNISDLWSAVNHLLQGKVKSAAEHALRVGVNTTLGFGGVLDIATEAQLPRQSEDFGQTLGVWGVGPGPYLVLPVLGPTTLRDAVARPLDRLADPNQWALKEARDTNASSLLQFVHIRAGLLDTTRALDDAALDKYILVRDGALARRRNQVYDGDPPEEGPQAK